MFCHKSVEDAKLKGTSGSISNEITTHGADGSCPACGKESHPFSAMVKSSTLRIQTWIPNCPGRVIVNNHLDC